jgi:23S rRNA pseudouridine1911/1915/1917 synthase
MKVSLGQGDIATLKVTLRFKMVPKFIYEDNHILVLEKYPGLLSQGDNTGHPNLMDIVKKYLKEKYNKPGDVYLGLLQRYDRPVGGIMVMAKTSKAFTRLHDQIKYRKVDKYYLAVTRVAPPQKSGELLHYLVKDESANKTAVYDEPIQGSKDARLFYEYLGEKKGKCLLRIKLITGRSHQIRAQLAHIGCPLVGDVKYGNSLPKPAYDLCLYAYKIGFEHPVLKERMEFVHFPKIMGCWEGMDEFFEEIS